MEKRLNTIFYSYDTAAGLSGDKKLIYNEYRRLHPNDKEITLRKVQEYLSLQEIYTLHRNSRKIIPRNLIFAGKMGFLFAGDLIDFGEYIEHNNGMRYIFVIIDCFSKLAFAEPMKTKSAVETLLTFRKMLSRFPIKPSAISLDFGTEYWNKLFIAFMKQEHIHMYGVAGVTKNSIIERFIRTIKTKIYRIFDLKRNRTWVNILSKVILGYNNTFHSAIGMSPNKVNKFNEYEVYRKLYSGQELKKKPKLKTGDVVRIGLARGPFAKTFEQSYSRAVYIISKGPYFPRRGYLPMYKLTETDGEKITGGFYEYELLLVDKKKFLDNYDFPIEKVLKKRGGRSFVKFLGYPTRMNAWVTL